MRQPMRQSPRPPLSELTREPAGHAASGEANPQAIHEAVREGDREAIAEGITHEIPGESSEATTDRFSEATTDRFSEATTDRFSEAITDRFSQAITDEITASIQAEPLGAISDLESEPLRPIPLAELRLQSQGRHWRVEQRIAGLDSLTPVQGQLKALHHGTALELSAEAETIVTLCCDRCLQHYNHALRAEVHELVELRGQGHGAAADPCELLNLELARDGMPEGADLDDRLDPAGHFDPERWLFEQLNLRLPLVNRCGDDCPGPATWSSEPSGGDPRWAALAQLGLGAPEAAAGSDAAARADQGVDHHHGLEPDAGARSDSGPRPNPRA